MRNKILSIFLILSFVNIYDLSADNISTTLENLINSLENNNNIINAKKDFSNAVIEQKYSYLQWWTPSVKLTNDSIYPYKHDYYDDTMTSNMSSFIFQAPFFTGTMLDLSVSYGINRDILDSVTVIPIKWGFSQDIQYKIGIGQSLNPWWLHYRRNPYKAISNINVNLSENNINRQIKTSFFSCIQNYISLRKMERNKDILMKRISLYDDIMNTYLKIQADGIVSWKDIQEIRNDKWEDEQNYFTLEHEIINTQDILYKLTGVRVGLTAHEELFEIDAAAVKNIFPFLNITDLSRSDEINIHLQKEIIDIDKWINRQSNAPVIKFEFGSYYKLPVREKDDMADAWDKKNFDDNILNNWSFSVNIDVSNYLTSINTKNVLQYKNARVTLDRLLLDTHENTKYEKKQNAIFIKLLEDQIKRLDDIIQKEAKIIDDAKTMFERGALTEFDYRKIIIEYELKCVLLRNLNDEIWMRKFISMFY
jgi:hypothetical protein